MKEFLDRMFDRLSELRIFQPGSLSGPAVAAVVGGGVLLIGVIVWASLHQSKPPPAPLPEGAPWVCKNGHEFTPTERQLNDHFAKHPPDPVLCPTCGAEADRAVKCPSCGHVVVPGPDHLCPNCKNPINHY